MATKGKKKQRVSIIAIDECSGSALMGAVDIFNAANVIWRLLSDSSEDLFLTQVVSPDGGSVTCSNSYTVSVDGDLELVTERDGIICIPFSTSSSGKFLNALEKQKQLVEWLRRYGHEFQFLAAISVGVFLLAEAGQLEGKTAATAWWFDRIFKQRYPDIRVSTKTVCVTDGNVLSTGSMSGYNDICMEIVERVAGRSFARSMSRYLINDYERRSVAPQLYASQVHSSNPVVNQADAWIQRNLANHIRVGEVAEHVAVSTRTLNRYFQSTFGDTPQQYIQKSRIEKGKLLLDITELDSSQIAYRCGYGYPGSFRRLFKKYCSVSPATYRKNCRKSED